MHGKAGGGAPRTAGSVGGPKPLDMFSCNTITWPRDALEIQLESLPDSKNAQLRLTLSWQFSSYFSALSARATSHVGPFGTGG